MVFHLARIVAKTVASPTVTTLELQVPTLATFFPGQWVDFVAPPHTWVGGFSLASSPEGLPIVMLAVKASNQKPAQWVTHESKVGDKVEIRVGGTCILQQEFDRPAVFCAGGIGISPLLSMYQQHIQERGAIGKGASFLYLASGEDELVFVDELMGLVSSKQDRLILSLTQQSAWTNQLEGVECVTGRGVMQSFLCNDSPSDALFYVCGPPSVLDDAIDFLEQRGIPSNKVLYEKWW